MIKSQKIAAIVSNIETLGFEMLKENDDGIYVVHFVGTDQGRKKEIHMLVQDALFQD